MGHSGYNMLNGMASILLISYSHLLSLLWEWLFHYHSRMLNHSRSKILSEYLDYLELVYFSICLKLSLTFMNVLNIIYLVRVLGILQRIALCYCLVSLVHVLTDYGNKTYRFVGAVFAVGCLLTYMAYMLTF